MTIALCTECGAKKFGAFSPCEECGFTPASGAEMAKSVLLSDHHYTQAELDELSKANRTGEKIDFDPLSVAEYESALELLESDPEGL